MIKTVIFDLDGTLLNTLEDLKDSTNYALEQFGFPTRTLEEIRKFVGDGVRKLIERAVPTDCDAETTENVWQFLNNIIRKICIIIQNPTIVS